MAPDDRESPWFVLIEQFVNAAGGRIPSVTDFMRAGGYEEAVERARDIAFRFEPQHPMNPWRRSVYQAGDDSWIVLVEGATRTYQFRVFVARRRTPVSGGRA